MRGSVRRNLGWVEAGFYLAGLALLATFFMLRFEGERQREAGLAAFHASVEMGSLPAPHSERQVSLAAQPSGEGIVAEISAPDVALWADKRIREYTESLRVEADPPLAVMTIDKLGIQVPVYDGADDFNLNRGVGRIKGTDLVGGAGNLGIAGHRDGFFRGLKDIEIGDSIDLMTPRGTDVYSVSSIAIVDPDDVWVLAPSDEKTITLVTCYPFYYVGHAPQRFIVKATAGHSLANNP